MMPSAPQPETATSPNVRLDLPARLREIYRRWEKYLPVATFAAGFIWDSVTLTRIDRWSDNLILLGYLLALAFMIIVTLRRQAGRLQYEWLQRIEPHFHYATQFLLGGLLSSYVIYYSRSASWTRTQVFLFMLVGLFVGNEFLQNRLGNPRLLSALFSFSLFSCLTFLLPIILQSVHTWVFLLAAVLSLGISSGTLLIAVPLRQPDWLKRMGPPAVTTCSVHALLIILYFSNLIPPVPLALKEVGIYHSVRRADSGYEVQYVRQPFYRFWKRWEDPFLWKPGEGVFCFTAVFAPGGIRVPVRHVWSQEVAGQGWVRRDVMSFPITGGREGGYRGFSWKKTVAPGNWRVEVETDQGRILGQVSFEIVEAVSSHPPLETRVIP